MEHASLYQAAPKQKMDSDGSHDALTYEIPRVQSTMSHPLPEITGTMASHRPSIAIDGRMPKPQPISSFPHSSSALPEPSDIGASSEHEHSSVDTPPQRFGQHKPATWIYDSSHVDMGHNPGIVGPVTIDHMPSYASNTAIQNTSAANFPPVHAKPLVPNLQESSNRKASQDVLAANSTPKSLQPTLLNSSGQQRWDLKGSTYDEVASFSADYQLGEYWVSGIDGSYPHLPPERLTRYYSIGKTQPFSGDIMDPGVAAEAFLRCSFQKEIIMMCTDVGDIWLEFVFGQILMMQERGYAHILVYMDSKKHCDKFLK
jgi:hypothetical protein